MGNHILVLEGPLSQGLTGDLMQAGWPARAIADVAHLLQQKSAGDLLIIDTQMSNFTPALCHLLTTQSEAPVLLVTPKSEASLAPAMLSAQGYQPPSCQASADWLAQPSVPVVEVGGLCIDLPGWCITVDGAPVTLSSTEFRFLAYLAQQIGKVVTYDELLEQVWSYCPQTGDRKVITNCVKRLRYKLGSNAVCPRYIVAVPGVGYRLRNQRQWIEEYSPNLVVYRRPLSLCADWRRHLPGFCRLLLLDSQVHRQADQRTAGPVELLAHLHRLQCDLFPDAHCRAVGHAAPRLHL